MALVVAYAVVMPRARTRTGAIGLGIGALIAAIVLFWNPAPVVLGTAAVTLGYEQRSRVAVALGVVSAASPLLMLIVGTIADT